MHYDFRMIRGKDFLRLDAQGHFDMAATRNMLRDTIWACTQSKMGRVLLDIRDASTTLTTAQMFQLAQVCQEVSPTTEEHRIAILNRPTDDLDRAETVANAAAEHGWNIAVFRDFEVMFKRLMS
jgi:hypothetical protein